jgi:hypothetical protein
LLVFLSLSFWLANAASSTDQSFVLDNTCAYGNNYIQFVGFTCLADAEMARNPLYNGQDWRVQGNYNTLAFQLMNRKFNQLGIHVGNTTYCSNFTVRQFGDDGTSRSAGQEHHKRWRTFWTPKLRAPVPSSKRSSQSLCLDLKLTIAFFSSMDTRLSMVAAMEALLLDHTPVKSRPNGPQKATSSSPPSLVL